MMTTRFTKNSVSALALGLALAGSVANAQSTTTIRVLPNTEPETGPINNNSGFVLSLDGAPLDADPQIEDQVRKTDIALAQADVQVQLNTLDPTPRLDVEVAGPPRTYRSGDQITLISETNYPVFIDRAEMRIIDRAASGGSRLVSTVPIAANGQATVVLPEGRDLVVVHRVYDARGRYDETQALPLSVADDRGQLDTVEEGSLFTARRGIRVTGGTITVSATNVRPGAVMQTLGETVRADAQGRLVIERILPAGDHIVDVSVTGAGQNIGLTRPVAVPGAEWFYVGVADLTYGRFSSGQTNETTTRTTGRLQFYVNGETNSGLEVTASLDTGEEDINQIFRRLDGKNPRDIIDRIDPNEGYPTYGDDSTLEDTTPTSGKIYVRVAKNDNFALWGDYQAEIDGNGYLRNERSLYGAQVHYETQTTTKSGNARAVFDLYAAQPEQQVARDSFRGTGGSVYFLRQQDISLGTETVTVEIRDAATGRVVERRKLLKGRDYQINPVQGIVTLKQPLTGSVDRRLISTDPSGDEVVNLIVQYEFTPTSSDVDGFSYGGRAESWVTNDLRVGVTTLMDDTGIQEQHSTGVDLRYELGDNSFVQLDYAKSKGTGFSTSVSNDGGLVFDTNTSAGGSGRAVKLEAQLDLEDLGSNRSGVVGGYFEDRTVGFGTLDYKVEADTGDETLYGVFLKVDKADSALGYHIYADHHENGAGAKRTELGAEISGEITGRLSFDTGFEHLEKASTTETGNRTDVALRLTYAAREDLDFYAFGQATVASDGLDNNERFGLGVKGTFGNGWDVGAEVSDGRGGLGARVLLTQNRDDNSSVYFGYDLDPGRALDAGVAASDNGGRYVAGGRQQINEDIAAFAENTYDIFGTSRELIGAYGVTYTPSDFLSYTMTFDMGQLRDETNGNIDRRALSFGLHYEHNKLRAAGRVELRRDHYEDPAKNDTQAIFLVADADYRISDDSRLVFSADLAKTEANGASFKQGSLVDASIGYAYRPIENERLNMLASYRYYLDDIGQEVNGISDTSPVQESHVVSIEGNYDLNEYWTLGGKLGGRWTESAANAGGERVSNDAWLAAINLRYHLVQNWDVLLEGRHLALVDAGSTQTSLLGAAYRHMGNNAKIGIGYNFGSFSSDLTDLTHDDKGLFLNLIAKF